MRAWLVEHPTFLVALALAAIGVWQQMPTKRVGRRGLGVALVAVGGGLGAWTLGVPLGPQAEQILFAVFGGGALLCGTLTITSRNPVYGALWFAVATLGVCGLFTLRGAPFMAAATIIVYAGAIIVTFVFVIMLARQSGASFYDQRSRQPALATCVATLLLGAILLAIQNRGVAAPESASTTTDAAAGRETASATVPNPLSRPRPGEAEGSMHNLGRSLFGDYLFSVELAGTLLLIASVGAIAIARREERKPS